MANVLPPPTPSALVKICGVKTLEDAQMAVAAGASAIGFNFFPKSPRYIRPQDAAEISQALPARICRVGVFVNASRAEVERMAREVDLSALQFHGEESADDCRGWNLKVIKAVRTCDPSTVRRAADYPVDFILVDAYVEGLAGGTGRLARWDWLTELDRERLILAGGLNPENVAEAIRLLRPFAVDVASGVEIEPGRKDPELMRRFISNAKSA